MHAQTMTLDDIRATYRSALITAAGVDPASMNGPGVTVAGEQSRADSGLASAYVIGPHLLVRTDPAITDQVGALVTGIEPTIRAFLAACAGACEVLGAGTNLLGATGDLAPAQPVRSLDGADPADRNLIAELVDAAGEEAADEAEIELDDLDERIVGIESGGQLVAYASERPWDVDERFADIGVLCHPEHLRQGLGAAVVAALAHDVFEVDRIPLYRHNDDNIASHRLARRVGFTVETNLAAVSFPAAD